MTLNAPQADAGWIGEAGPGPSYLDPGSGGSENDFSNRNSHLHDVELAALATHMEKHGETRAPPRLTATQAQLGRWCRWPRQ